MENDRKDTQETKGAEEKDNNNQGDKKEKETSTDMEIDQVGTPKRDNASTGRSTITTTSGSTTTTSMTMGGSPMNTYARVATRDIVSPPKNCPNNLAQQTFLSDASALRIQCTHVVCYDI